MRVCYDKDAGLSLTKGRTVAIIGYSPQGRARAANLKDSGVNAVIGLCQGGSWKKAEAAGHGVRTVTGATKAASVVMILLPDGNQLIVYKNEIEPNLKEDMVLALTHGLNIHYNQVVPRADFDVIMVAPRGPGHTMHNEFLKGGDIPFLIAVYQGKGDKTCDIALPYTTANGGTEGDVIETSFREETETDLFDERAASCGGVVELTKTSFETLTEAGYAPEMVYFECLRETKLIVDLIYEGGIANVNYSISGNAGYDKCITDVEIINDRSREAMYSALKRIQIGEYAKMFIQEGAVSYASMTTRRCLIADHQIERAGAQLCSMVPRIAKNKPVDQGKS